MRLVSVAGFCKLRGIPLKCGKFFKNPGISGENADFTFWETASDVLFDLRSAWREEILKNIAKLKPKDQKEAEKAVKSLDLREDYCKKTFEGRKYYDLLRGILNLTCPKGLRPEKRPKK